MKQSKDITQRCISQIANQRRADRGFLRGLCRRGGSRFFTDFLTSYACSHFFSFSKASLRDKSGGLQQDPMWQWDGPQGGCHCAHVVVIHAKVIAEYCVNIGEAVIWKAPESLKNYRPVGTWKVWKGFIFKQSSWSFRSFTECLTIRSFLIPLFDLFYWFFLPLLIASHPICYLGEQRPTRALNLALLADGLSGSIAVVWAWKKNILFLF